VSTSTEFDKDVDDALTLFQSNLASAYRAFSPSDQFSAVLKEEATKAIKQAVDKYVIGEDVPNDGAEIVRNTSGEAKGRSAGSYAESCKRELRTEQRQSLWGDK
jgi:hypothetical protein